MATNPKAIAQEKAGKVEYEWGSLWPHYHKEKMNWAMGFRTKGDVDIILASGFTGRDPNEDSRVITYEDYRSGKGKVLQGINAQTNQALTDIMNNLETMGASLKNIVFFRYYVRHPEDYFGFREELQLFFEKYEPDLITNLRPSTLLNGVGLALPEMRVEIEAWAVVPRKNTK